MAKEKNTVDNILWPEDDDDDDLLCAMQISEQDQIDVGHISSPQKEDDAPAKQPNGFPQQSTSSFTSDTEDDENVPLARLIPAHLTSDTSEADSSGVDETYKPSESSDSSDSPILVRESRKRTRSIPGQKYRKRQKKSLSRIPVSSDPSSDYDLHKAQQTSAELQTLLTLARNFHNKRLKLLLNSNNLQISNVARDGNCFFSAVLKSLQDTRNPQSLRDQTCKHILDNSENYMGFLMIEDNNDVDKLSLFKHEVSKLSNNGNWKSPLGDCLPLAIANIFERPLRIFSSSVSTPVQQIEPDLTPPNNNCINLGYIAVRGEEHYEGVVPLTAPPVTPEKLVGDHGNTSMQSPSVTPHKRANYRSPKKVVSSRKRLKHQNQWKKTVRKEKRCRGEAYVSCRGKPVEAKNLQEVNCGKCRFECSKNIDLETRQTIFQNYYKLSSYERQRSFVCQMVDSVTPVRSTGKKTTSRQYHLVFGEKKVRVCRNFFLATLNIGRRVVEHALTKKEHGVFTGEDGRGVCASGNKTDLQTLHAVRQHIDSFPRMESHYARKDSVKKYLAQDLNIKKMYTLYKEKCQKSDAKFVTESKYREVFCTEFNISFFRPKKDQCSMCSLYEAKKLAGTVETDMTNKYEDHQRSKVMSRDEKERDKVTAKSNKSHYVATFDLQAALNTPCSLVGELYYARKLSVYNLSVYSLGNQQGTCHLWDETNGKRGANEIATCLFKNTSSVCQLNKQVKEVTYFSDSCGGQNRNQFVAGSLLYSLQQSSRLQKLNQKFLTSGHSQMECDSIHSSIETAKKRTQVFVPAQWSTVISLAKGGKQYLTIPMKFGDVLDFKEFVRTSYPNMKISVGGERVNWLRIKWIRVRREAVDSIFVNYSFQEEDFLEIKVLSGTRRKSLTAPKHPVPAYTSKLPISVAKKKDLLTLCAKEIIPSEFRSYHESLPTSTTSVDRLPGPASDEEWDD